MTMEAQGELDRQHLQWLRWGFVGSAVVYGIFGLPIAVIAYDGRLPLMVVCRSCSVTPPPFMWVFRVFGIVMGALALVHIAMKALAAVRIGQRRSRTLCLVAGALGFWEGLPGIALAVAAFSVLHGPVCGHCSATETPKALPVGSWLVTINPNPTRLD